MRLRAWRSDTPSTAKAGSVSAEVPEGLVELRGDEQRHRDADQHVRDRHRRRHALRLARQELRHRARLEVTIGPLPRVVAGSHELGQVFLNLLMKHMNQFVVVQVSKKLQQQWHLSVC